MKSPDLLDNVQRYISKHVADAGGTDSLLSVCEAQEVAGRRQTGCAKSDLDFRKGGSRSTMATGMRKSWWNKFHPTWLDNVQ